VVARWRRAVPARVEAPAWYRTFDLAAWDEMDGTEERMCAGSTGRAWPDAEPSRWPGWPQWLHEVHAERRWREAQHEYRRKHQELADQEFEDLVNGLPE
jgi:hypothetical protein